MEIDDYGGGNPIANMSGSTGYVGDIAQSVITGQPPEILKPSKIQPSKPPEILKPATNVSDDTEEVLGTARQYAPGGGLTQTALEEKEAKELAHAEEREDTVFQRSIEDMRKAGWNTDGIGAQASPAVARLDTTRSEGDKERRAEMERLLEQLRVAIEEGRKDRIQRYVSDILGMFSVKVSN